MKFVAGKSGRKITDDSSIIATAGRCLRSEGGFGLYVELNISLPGVVVKEASEIIEKAHQVCLYSNATRENINVHLNFL